MRCAAALRKAASLPLLLLLMLMLDGGALRAASADELADDDDQLTLGDEPPPSAGGGRMPGDSEGVIRPHITLALVHLHQHKIMYRDLKPENALIDEHDQCVLTDFGLAKEMTSSCENRQTVTGTLGFMAPEIMQASYDFSVDIYALGITFLITLLGEDAGELRYFKGRNVLLAPHHRDLPRIFKNHGDRLPPSALKLIRGHLVSESPSSRKPATSVSRSRFFTDFLGPDWKEKSGCASAASHDAEPAAEQIVEDDVQPDADDHSGKSGGTSELPDPTPEQIARRRGAHQAFLKRKSQEQQLRAPATVRFSPAVVETEVRI